jgi:hypothetical protein
MEITVNKRECKLPRDGLEPAHYYNYFYFNVKTSGRRNALKTHFKSLSYEETIYVIVTDVTSTSDLTRNVYALFTLLN